MHSKNYIDSAGKAYLSVHETECTICTKETNRDENKSKMSEENKEGKY